MTEAKKPMGRRKVVVLDPTEKAVISVERDREQERSADRARIDAISLELKKQIDSINRELNKQQIIYNNNFAAMEDAIKSSWSYKIRDWLGW